MMRKTTKNMIGKLKQLLGIKAESSEKLDQEENDMEKEIKVLLEKKRNANRSSERDPCNINGVD